MPKTKNEVITRAMRHIRVLGANETADADMVATAGDVLDALFAEFQQTQGVTFSWALDATPDGAFLPLAYLLGAEIAPDYNRPAQSRSRAIGRLRAFAIDDDRPDSRDLDEDGTISDAEIDAAARAAYY